MTHTDFDLAFLRDLKHRLRMALKQIEKAEKWLKVEARRAQRSPSAEQIDAALNYYANLKASRHAQDCEQPTAGLALSQPPPSYSKGE